LKRKKQLVPGPYHHAKNLSDSAELPLASEMVKWKTSDMATSAGDWFKPVRMLVLPNEEGLVALMASMGQDAWCIFSLDRHGPAHSDIFEKRSEGEQFFWLMCQKLSEANQQEIVRKLDDPKTTEKERNALLNEFGRLRNADDEGYEPIFK
jgi:hypothetical protein